jgi:hypothetical protein
MTPDELEAAVLGGDAARVVALLAGAAEADRLACGARMARLRKEHGDWPVLAGQRSVNDTTLLALLGTGTAAQIRGGRRMYVHEAAGTVLRLRPCELLVELAPWMLEHLGWAFVRRLVRDGTIPRPLGDAYIVGMLDGFTDAPTLLRGDPDLLDHEVWRLFEVEGTGDHSLADHDKYNPESKSWSRALLDHAGARLDRDRLLDASLNALERDFPTFRAGWYSRFHEALGPTPDERARRVDAYLRLLRSPVAPTVSLALGALSAVQKAGRLDGGRLLAHIEPALTARAAGTGREGLRLIDRAVADEPALAAAARRPAAAALAHASPDVQRSALSLFEARLGPLDAEDVALHEERRGDVAASVLPRLDALVGRLTEGGPRQPAEEPSRHSRPAPGAASGAGRRDPFQALEPLTPVGSVSDLVELLAGVLEREAPAESLELALDGALRLCGGRPTDFERLTKAVRVRSARLLSAGREPGIATWFAELVLAWVDGRPPEAGRPMPGALAESLAQRVRGVALEVAAGRSRALAARPSYVGGWIEPVDLVARLATLPLTGSPAATGVVARPAVPGRPGVPAAPDLVPDVVQALLRVLPVRRDAALAAASSLPGEIGEAVRYALGGSARVGPTAALWAAAARCRTPGADDPAVARTHPSLGPDGAVAGRYSLVVGLRRYVGQPQVDANMPTADPRDDVPTDLIWRVSAHAAGPGKEGPLVDWMRLIWPQDRRSWFAVSSALLLDNLDWREARWHDRQRLEALFEPWTQLGREAALLVAVGLQAKESGQRGLTVDAAAEAVDVGRLPAELVVRGLDEVAAALEVQPASDFQITLFRPGRLAQSLDEVARRSDQHRIWALTVGAGALERMQRTALPQPVRVGQVTPMLRLLVELTARLGATVPEAARPALRALSTSAGEGGRLARSLLAASPAQP